jgi:hypothetical protein
MKNTALALLLIPFAHITMTTAGDHHPMTSKEDQKYGREITIKNLSPAKLTITVKNDPDNPTQIVIPGNDTGSIVVNEPRLQVHIEANYDGKILKTNFKRSKNSENYWEIKIRKAIIGGIQLLTRESRPTQH